MRSVDLFIYLICGPLLAWNLYGWIREILFYQRNAWNWDMDSGAPKMHYGDDGYIGDEMSPRAHLLWLPPVYRALPGFHPRGYFSGPCERIDLNFAISAVSLAIRAWLGGSARMAALMAGARAWAGARGQAQARIRL